MIIVKLIGGLGNQMFQYACGKALAMKHGVELKVDLSDLEKDPGAAYTKRHYELHVFAAQINIATKEEVRPFYKGTDQALVRFFKRTFPSLFSHLLVNERGHLFQEDVVSYPPNTYLNGYWQHENYFKQIRSQLLQDFTPANEMPSDLHATRDAILAGNSVSIHVRRGDYVTLSSAGAFHGVCSPDYYKKALETIQSKQENIRVFVFSDDPEWCRLNLNLHPSTQFIRHAHHAAWDLQLMRLCKHQIIANSSFSWWAAWLNEHAGKCVMAPEFWFANTKSSELGILPKDWYIVA